MTLVTLRTVVGPSMTLVTLVMLGSPSITLVTFATSGTVKTQQTHVTTLKLQSALPLDTGNSLFACVSHNK